MMVEFARNLGLPLVPVKAYFVLLLNNESSATNHHMLKVLVDIKVVNIVANFEVWSGAQYNINLGAVWLCQVHAHITCKKWYST